MRIVQVNCVYGKGSTGKIVEILHREYQRRGHHSFALYGRGQVVSDQPNVTKVAGELTSKARIGISRVTGNVYGMALLPTWYIERIILHIRPDVVHLHCINGYFCNIFRLITWLKQAQIPTVVTQHAEFFYTGNCGYAFDCEQWKTGCRSCHAPKSAIGSRRNAAPANNWMRMQKSFDGFERLRLVGVSDWVSERSDASGILGQYSCRTVLNGLETSVFRYAGINRKRAPAYEVIYVTPCFEDENKGGEWLLRLARETVDLPIHYTVVGRTKHQYEVSNISFLGPVKDTSLLAQLYSSADVCLLTSKRETFSMVTAEALCCGTPVIGFMAGAPERICLPEYCDFVPYGNLESLRSALLSMLKRGVDKPVLSEIARQKYSSERMAEEYLDIYHALIEG